MRGVLLDVARHHASTVSNRAFHWVRPNQVELFQPLHVVALVQLGMPFGEIWDLEAVGSPLNALAVK
jgi:hypothetical protein